MSELPCRGGRLESCDGGELGDFGIFHHSYHDKDIEPVEWELGSEPSFSSWLGWGEAFGFTPNGRLLCAGGGGGPTGKGEVSGSVEPRLG